MRLEIERYPLALNVTFKEFVFFEFSEAKLVFSHVLAQS
jgi:hypothetical protein